MKSNRLIGCLVLVSTLVSAQSIAEKLSAKELMRRVQTEEGAQDEVFDLKMALIDSSANERRRTATAYKKKRGTEEIYKRLIVFHDPPELRKSGVLTLENAERENDQWVYLPAYHTTRRIASENRRNYYMGTDFTYEDIFTQKLNQYKYVLLREEKYAQTACQVIEAVPVEPTLKKESGYSKTIYWIDAERNLTLKAEFHDQDGKLLKIHTASKPLKIAGKYRLAHMEIQNIQERHRTVVDYTNFQINQQLSNSIFTLRYLERGR